MSNNVKLSGTLSLKKDRYLTGRLSAKLFASRLLSVLSLTLRQRMRKKRLTITAGKHDSAGLRGASLLGLPRVGSLAVSLFLTLLTTLSLIPTTPASSYTTTGRRSLLRSTLVPLLVPSSSENYPTYRYQ